MHFSYLIKTIESENLTIFARQSVSGRATVADTVYISLKGDIVLNMRTNKYFCQTWEKKKNLTKENQAV
jgi:phosphohistidine swiveling domain-containing protein